MQDNNESEIRKIARLKGEEEVVEVGEREREWLFESFSWQSSLLQFSSFWVSLVFS